MDYLVVESIKENGEWQHQVRAWIDDYGRAVSVAEDVAYKSGKEGFDKNESLYECSVIKTCIGFSISNAKYASDCAFVEVDNESDILPFGEFGPSVRLDCRS